MDTSPVEWDDPQPCEPSRDPGVWQQNIQPELERLETSEATK